MTRPCVSIVVPTRNPGPSRFRRLLESLRGQRDVDVEVVVVDSASTDGTERLLTLADVCVAIDPSQFDHAWTRNLGVAKSSGAVVVFLTHDAIPRSDTSIATLTRPIVEEVAVASYGRQMAGEDASILERVAREIAYGPEDRVQGGAHADLGDVRTYWFSNVASAVQRAAFDAVGGFEGPTLFNEDMVLAARLIGEGHVIRYVAGAEFEHHHDYTGVQVLKRYFDNAVSMCFAPQPLRTARSLGYGRRLLTAQVRAIVQAQAIGALPALMSHTTAKLVGYRLGRAYVRMPPRIRRALTLQPDASFWSQLDVD